MNPTVVSDFVLFAFWSPGPAEMMVLAVVALLLYGGNLPEVARSWGKSFAEFRRGLSGFQSELNQVIYSEPEQIEYRDDSHFADGYEDADSYGNSDEIPEQSEQERSEQAQSGDGPGSASDKPELTDEEKTVTDTSAETVVVEPPEEKSAN